MQLNFRRAAFERGDFMSDLVLVYEPGSAEHARVYGEALSRTFPGRRILATSKRAEALARAPEAAVFMAKAQDVSAEFIAAMPRLRWVQALTTGVDPLRALALPPSILVTSARGIHGPQMAELAILLMMALPRAFPRMLDNQRHARWERWGQPLLTGKTVVIVGVGNISEALAKRCRPLGLTIVGVSSRTAVPHFDELLPRSGLAKAAGRADFLVLLVPYSPGTHHLIDAGVLAAMKPSAYLLNLARGGVVDEAALTEALQQRRIAGAGLDVFSQEPLPPASPLWSLDNVIVTPHIGGMSDVYAEQLLPLLEHNLRAHFAADHAGLLNRVTF
jgi:phosphoglycerate dehydrogenase-like enzyme